MIISDSQLLLVTEIMVWISNYNHGFLWDISIPPCPNLNCNLSTMSFKLGYERAITLHISYGCDKSQSQCWLISDGKMIPDDIRLLYK